MIVSTARRSALFLVLLAAAGCASAPAPGTAPAPAARDAEFEALFQARADSARLRFTEADVHFMTGMIAHHAQALVIAALAPTHGASPSVQTLAARIINAQRDEIALMQQWLRERGREVPEVHIVGTTLMIHGGGEHAHHHAHMPGMLSDDQIRQLDTARGAAFDRLFLTLMIEHHRGAVVMVDQLFATDGAAQGEAVFRFASDVHVDQTTEVARMESMLAAMRAGAGRP
jgi:uncharacterized protein (DUF305 family)